MFTFCEPSGSMCRWNDDRCGESAGFGRHDAFVSDDLVSYPQTMQEDLAPGDLEHAVVAETPSACRQPSNVIPNASPQTADIVERAVVATVRPPAAASRRFQQSNGGNRRQMGGVKQTNRFFARRQFA